MAKKSRKPNLPQETLQRARQELYGESPETPKIDTAHAVTVKPAGFTSVKRREVDLRVEYAYVITDLKNMAMLAAGLMIVLVVLSFVI